MRGLFIQPTHYSNASYTLFRLHINLIIRCILGDIRLWVGDTSTSSCLVWPPPKSVSANQPALSLACVVLLAGGRDRGSRDSPQPDPEVLPPSQMRVSTYIRRGICTYIRRGICTYIRRGICTYIRTYTHLSGVYIG